MKKLLLSALLGLAVLAGTPALSQAGTFGLFTNCSWFGCWGCGCGNSCSTFCVRPYNAFTPVCSGNITCMGCMPFAPMPNYSGLGYYGPPANYDMTPMNSCEMSGSCIMSTPDASAQGLPPLPQEYTQPPAPMSTTPVLPAPVPVPQLQAPGMSQAPNAYNTIQADYRVPTAPQAYYPYGYYNYGTMGKTPYYWNAK